MKQKARIHEDCNLPTSKTRTTPMNLIATSFHFCEWLRSSIMVSDLFFVHGRKFNLFNIPYANWNNVFKVKVPVKYIIFCNSFGIVFWLWVPKLAYSISITFYVIFSFTNIIVLLFVIAILILILVFSRLINFLEYLLQILSLEGTLFPIF